MLGWFQRTLVPLSLTLRDREAVVSKGEARAWIFQRPICDWPERVGERVFPQWDNPLEEKALTRRFAPTSPASGRGERAAPRLYSDIGLSEMSQSLPVKVEMNSVFIGV